MLDPKNGFTEVEGDEIAPYSGTEVFASDLSDSFPVCFDHFLQR